MYDLMRAFLTSLLILSIVFTFRAQTQEELLAKKAEKETELALLQPQLNELTGKVDALKSELAVLTEQTTPYPRWDVGALGNLGFNFSSFTEWLSKSDPNTTAFNIGVTTNGFANLDQRTYFWRNSGNLTLGWIKFDDRDDPEDSKDF